MEDIQDAPTLGLGSRDGVPGLTRNSHGIDSLTNFYLQYNSEAIRSVRGV